MRTFTIHGCRGSRTTCGAEALKHGGDTTCFSFHTENQIVIFDAGTGIVELGNTLCALPQLPPITILFSHFHIDHIAGLTGFKPLYAEEANIRFMADAERFPRWRESLRILFGSPFWPVELERVPATVRFEDLNEYRRGWRAGTSTVTWCPLRHPQGCLAFRLAGPGGDVVIASDHEAGSREWDDALHAFAFKTDVLIYDAQYTPEEYIVRRGWGHSTWRHAVRAASRAHARELVLTHHDPERNDDALEAIEREARVVFAATRAARARMFLDPAGSVSSRVA